MHILLHQFSLEIFVDLFGTYDYRLKTDSGDWSQPHLEATPRR